MGTTITNTNAVHDGIRSVNSGYVCYHSVKKLLSSFTLSKILEIKEHKIAVLPLFCMVVIHDLLLSWKNIDYKCFESKYSENYLDPKQTLEVGNTQFVWCS
jgi:hypothetical protein